MPHPSKTIVLLPSTTATATATAAGHVNLPDQFTGFIAKLTVSAASGTPTLNVRIQRGIRDIVLADDTVIGDTTTGAITTAGIIWDDYAAFTQATATGTWYISVVGSGEEVYVASDGALAAGQVRNGPIGTLWRIQYTIGGGTPSLTFSVIAQLIP